MRRTVLNGLTSLLFVACTNVDQVAPSAPPATYPSGSTAQILEEIRRHWNLPAMGVLIIKDGKIVEQAVVGVRRVGDTTHAQRRDKWHVGSITKSMTASLAARLVERGMIGWESTIGEVLPDLMPQSDSRWRGVTLAQLLQMQGGADDSVVEQQWASIWADRAQDPVAQRRSLSATILRAAPARSAGGAWHYANASYVLAGHMLERRAGIPWETLMHREIFAPLAMVSSGFGAPANASATQADEPWGHTARDKAMTPVTPGLEADNPPALGPAGTVHGNLHDFGQYALAHLAAERGAGTWLSAESAARLHRADASIGQPGFPNGSRYAMGWLRWADVRAGGAQVLAHDGSNQSFYAYLWLVPSRNVALVVSANAGGAGAGAALDSVVTRFASNLEVFR